MGLNLLLIAYHYPPANMSGAARPARFAKFLPEFGVDCAVLANGNHGTRGCAVYVSKGDGPARQEWLYGFAQRYLLPLNERLEWAPAALATAEELMRRRRFDAILSTAPPLAPHLVALTLHRKHRLPWIADFRDPLAGNSTRRRKWLNYDAYLERRIFERASLCLANTDALAAQWRTAHPSLGHKIRVVWNGFDPDEPLPAPAPHRVGPRTIVHAGALYGERRPCGFLRALARLRESGRIGAHEWRAVLLGPSEPHTYSQCMEARELLETCGMLLIDNRVVSREEATAAQAGADVLLLLDMPDRDASVQVPAKLFEYVRTGAPILAWTPEGSPTMRLLRQCGLQTLCLPPGLSGEDTVERVAAFLSGPLERRRMSDEFRSRFDGRLQARELAQQIRQVTG